MKFPLLLFTVLVLLGCEKSFENFTPDSANNTGDSVWVTANSSLLPINELHASLMRQPQTDSFSIQTGATIQFSGTTRIEIPAAAFTNNGTVASGTAQLEFYLLKSKGDFIRFRKPSTSNSNLLQNQAILYLNVSRNGQSLQASKFIRTAFTDSLPGNMTKGFYGVAPNTGSLNNFNWIKDDSIIISTTATGYQVISNRMQWLGCGYGVDSTSVKSRTVLSMPSGFTNANTTAFIVYKNDLSVMQFVPDAANRIWLADKVPSGKAVTYITISKKGTEYWLGTHELTTSFNQNIRLVPERTNLSAINRFLDSL